MFPDDVLPVRGSLYLGAVLGWVDVTDDLRLERAASGGGVSITRGRQNEAADVDPARCSLVIDNAGGRYSPRNPAGPYAGLIGRNTPLMIAVGPPRQAVSFRGVTRGTGGLSTPDHASLRITGDIDVRFWCRAQWSGGVLPTDLGGRYVSAGNARSWQAYIGRTGRPGILWSPDGTLAARRDLTGPVAVTPADDGTLAVRMTLDVDNGAGGTTARFYQAADLAGPWVQLGGDVVAAGTTSIHAGTAPLQLGETPALATRTLAGDLFAAEIRDGIGGPLVAAPDLNAIDLAARTFTDGCGRPWSVGSTADVVDRAGRFWGEVASWPPRWDITGGDLWVPIEGAGVMRRLTQGAASLRSPLYRTFISQTPSAYLPMEDGTGATRPASAARGIPYGASVDVEFGADPGPGFGGTSTVAKLTSTMASISTPVRAGTGSGGHWSVAFYAKLAGAPFAGDRLLARVHVAGGAVARWELSVSSNSYHWQGYTAAGALVADRTTGFGTGADPTRWVAFALDVQTDGANTRWAGVWHGVGDTTFWATVPGGETLAGPIGNVTTAHLLGSDYAVDALVAHLVVTPAELPVVRDAFRRVSTGFAGERAGDRIRRLAAEEGVAVEVVGDAATTELCGPQRSAPLVDLLRAAARVDGGILQESRSLLGLLYRTRRSLYNQTPLPLSYTSGHIAEPFEPLDDDEAVANDITVSRPNGSSARATRRTGPLSTQRPPDGVGTYETTVSTDVAADGQLPDHAGWLLHLGTVDEARYPRIRADLAAPGYTPGLAAAAAGIDAGDVLALTDLPAWLPPGPTPVMVQGYVEVLDAYRREITYNGTPGSPWTVAVVASDSQTALDDGPAVTRFGADAVLAAAVTETASQLTATSTAVGFTARRAEAYPMLLSVDGEQVSVGMVGGVLNADPWCGATTSWVGAGGATIAAAPTVRRGAYPSILATPNGTSAGAGIRSAASYTVTPGATYLVGAWVYAPAGYAAGAQVGIDWTLSGAAVSTGLGGAVALPAAVWTWLQVEIAAPASGINQGAPRVRLAGTAAPADVVYATQIILAPRASYSGLTQILTVAPGGRGLNGQARAHAAGVAVDVWHTAHIPL
ncbi:hypothetical protein [Micromonospora sp. RTGN7]|uniref:hypothetical protein n=1 Tax=Micromonospora sp. RTGN7 TaxID=3016526 RepID=UPI0029FEFCE5|nr:hypothetical protein [Micromonospora sp. RTGN7]